MAKDKRKKPAPKLPKLPELPERIRDLSGKLDRLDEAVGDKSSMLQYNIRAPYSTADSPVRREWSEDILN